ncbi:excinuclease ABC, A subunit [Candidatus Endolissoclinum faulkneri L5]|uniref:UvrABC system protein A n=1 Tax=Candidatus Endolissoclinum faulkneri L5 TaxID=1401328 RepID=V9TUI9_9PROT|nr:excinuclease ABC subunit UvrA [Candidatus Endolissoclinum faulkneri]AHC73353.1 excinuclease ABC, A subunit [Candidatus Endolissoclinum faulkneri L5]
MTIGSYFNCNAAVKSRLIRVRGARENNLRNLDIDLPRNSLIVITGISGSGKSSLAFNTIYAEGQRRYVESLSAYARQFLELMKKPDVDLVEGLSPAISIKQKITSNNPRSTVGTITGIYDYLRLLFARIGIPYSPTTGLPIESQTVSQIVDQICSISHGTRIYLLAPIRNTQKDECLNRLLEIRKLGFPRVRIDGHLYETKDLPNFNEEYQHNIEVLVDRIVVRDGIKIRLADSVETALELSSGQIFIDDANSGQRYHTFSTKCACPVTGFTVQEIEPRLFSFNSPFGSCQACNGIGNYTYFDEQLIVPNPKLSLKNGAIAPLEKQSKKYYPLLLRSLLKNFNIFNDIPFEKLPETIRTSILLGVNNTSTSTSSTDSSHNDQSKKLFDGIIPHMEQQWKETKSPLIRQDLSRFRSFSPCEECKGKRLRPEALAVKIDGLNINDVANFSINKAACWVKELSNNISNKQKKIIEIILPTIQERLSFLKNVGLNYLTLSRSSSTLSAGEQQRIRLASQIGTTLTGVIYVMDEPSIGLHQRDNDRLFATIQHLRDVGNTVIVVEHDEDTIRKADYVVDMGPGAGINGGSVTSAGTPREIMANSASMTGKYLTGVKQIEVPAMRRKAKNNKQITLIGATGNNLKNINISIPLSTFTCISGVSGSGKSTLIIETLWKALASRLHNNREHPAPFKQLKGIENIDKVIDVDQIPISHTPRSSPATYSGIFSSIRDWFANLPEAQARGYTASRFSFNLRGGRCEACGGDGIIKVDMHFLPPMDVICDSCKGKRYNREILEIKFRNQSISDVLDMTVEEVAIFFKAVPSILDKLETLKQVGLSYIKIGQQTNTLSGGEAQRMKLAKELSRRTTGKTVYIMDEPTTGLHFEDIRKLLEVLQSLVNKGNTVIVIEHNLEIIKTADYVIDLGPEGGEAGGKIVAQGTPEEIVTAKNSYTTHYLKRYLPRA